jgi:hypothetical protein
MTGSERKQRGYTASSFCGRRGSGYSKSDGERRRGSRWKRNSLQNA